MDVPDSALVANRDWDPSYLHNIFEADFDDYSDLWCSNISDMDLKEHVEHVERYCPLVEDISLDDETLCQAVKQIEQDIGNLEDVQYFQFDSYGNIYVFQPGAGFSGECKKVAPGDDFKLSWCESSEIKSNVIDGNVKELDLSEAVGGECHKDEDFPSFSDVSNKTSNRLLHEYHKPLAEEDLDSLTKKKFSVEMMKKVNWIKIMYQERMYSRNARSGVNEISCDLDDIGSVTQNSLKYAMCRFITEINKLDGTDFPPCTLYDLVICVQFYLESKGFTWKLISDDVFKELKFTLDNLMKQRTEIGLGSSVRKVMVLNVCDEDILWNLGLLGTSCPEVLLTTVMYVIGLSCSLQAGKEHHALRSICFESQFTFLHDHEGKLSFCYCEDIGLKTNKGSLKHRKLDAKVYQIANSSRCPVRILHMYLNLLPVGRKCQALYLQPKKHYSPTCWYRDSPVGENRMRSFVKELTSKAGIPGFYTNHSLRSTGCTRMYNDDIDEQVITEISGHRSNAVHSYKRMCPKQKQKAIKSMFGESQ